MNQGRRNGIGSQGGLDQLQGHEPGAAGWANSILLPLGQFKPVTDNVRFLWSPPERDSLVRPA